MSHRRSFRAKRMYPLLHIFTQGPSGKYPHISPPPVVYKPVKISVFTDSADALLMDMAQDQGVEALG